jgi:LysR family hydrogen peroxide-inducible transcriptional activator
MVVSGLGITVLPISAAVTSQYAESSFTVRPFSDPHPTRTVALAWRASYPRLKAIDKVCDAIQQCTKPTLENINLG